MFGGDFDENAVRVHLMGKTIVSVGQDIDQRAGTDMLLLGLDDDTTVTVRAERLHLSMAPTSDD